MASVQSEFYRQLEKQVCASYVEGVDSMRDVAERLGTNHKLVGRMLRRNNIKIVKAPTKPMSDVTKRKIGNKSRGRVAWNKGVSTAKTMPIISRLENMRSHLRWDVTIEWLEKFKDFDRLKFLNRSIARKRDFGDISTSFYKSFIEKFYYDNRFNCVYDKWVDSNMQKLLRPSLDHMLPKSRGGSGELNNLQFLTWFENLSKRDMTQKEWAEIKSNIGEYFV